MSKRKYTFKKYPHTCPICGEQFVGRESARTDKSSCRTKLSRWLRKGYSLKAITQYFKHNLNDDKEPSFGDIEIHVCLQCDYIWQRYGSFKPPVCGPQEKEG